MTTEPDANWTQTLNFVRVSVPHAPIAQLDRVLVSEAKGRRFDSCWARQQFCVPSSYLKIASKKLAVVILLFLVSNLTPASMFDSKPLSGSINTLISNTPNMIATFSPEALQTRWFSHYPYDQQALIETPVCGAQVNKFEYATVGGMGEPTNASGALMIPTGTAPQCSGPRPVVLYAHGTAIERSEDLSAVNDPKNPAYNLTIRIILVFVAQGYIVIAPNYAGYDVSKLPYAPYLNEKQQAQDMLDGLTAGRQMLAMIKNGATDGGKLFVTGYSQGGYVSMATLKALDGEGRPATAGAAMSGPYALAAAGDEVFLGHPNFGATVYLTMIANSYAHLPRGSINPGEIFNPLYADAHNLFPGSVDRAHLANLVHAGKIPLTAVFQTPPTGYSNIDSLQAGLFSSIWFDPTNYLVATAFRAAYVSDIKAHPDGAAPLDGSTPDFSTMPPDLPENPENLLRQDLKANDLRDYLPTMPLLMCGANRDPEVPWNQGAGTMTGMLNGKTGQNPSLSFVTLDLDTRGFPGTFTSHGLSDPQNIIMQRITSSAQSAFVAHQYRSEIDKLIPFLGLEGYHTAEEPYCAVAARAFFNLY